MRIDACLDQLMELIVCPACYERLIIQTKELACSSCGKHYPIEDGVPMLISGEAPTDRR